MSEVVYYLSSGEYRIDYGTVAALTRAGYSTFFVHLTDGKALSSNRVVEIADTNGHVIDVAVEELYTTSLERIIRLPGLGYPKPDVLVTDFHNWEVARRVCKRLDAELVFHYPVALHILQASYFLKFARAVKEMPFSLLSSTHKWFLCKLSDYSFLRDPISTRLLKSLGCGKASYLPPVYSRFSEHISHQSLQLREPYVLVYITVKRDSARHEAYTHRVMLYHLCQVAKKIKDISFYVVGTARNDIPEFASKVPANLILIGKVSDDVLSSLLYQKADAVIVPSFKPGNSNRILEAMFYSKAILTTSVMCKYHLGLIRGVNVLAEDDFNKYPQLINALVYDNNLRRRLERNIASLHNRMYTWKFLSHVFQSQRYYSR